MDVLKWGAVAYVCLILAFVAYGVMRSLNSPEYRASVARAERELAGPGADAPEPQPEPETLYEVAGSIFTRAEVDRLANLRHTPVAIERRRAMTVSETRQ